MAMTKSQNEFLLKNNFPYELQIEYKSTLHQSVKFSTLKYNDDLSYLCYFSYRIAYVNTTSTRDFLRIIDYNIFIVARLSAKHL